MLCLSEVYKCSYFWWGLFAYQPLKEPGKLSQVWSLSYQDCGVVSSRRFLGGVGVRFFCPTPTPNVQLDHFIHHTPKLGIPVDIVQYLLKLLLKQCFLLCTTISIDFNSQISFPLLRSRSRKFCKGRICYLRPRNPVRYAMRELSNGVSKNHPWITLSTHDQLLRVAVQQQIF